MLSGKNIPFTAELNDEFVLYLYQNVVSGIDNLDKKLPIIAVAKKQNIKITFLDKESYKGKDIKDNQINIYSEDYRNKAYSLFRHLRNAFTHQQIEIVENQCRFYDWNPFLYGKRRKKFNNRLVSMVGCVDYDKLKALIEAILAKNQENSKIETKNNEK